MRPKPALKRKPSTLILSILLSGLCLGLSACEMKLPPMPWDPKPDPNAAQKDGKDAEATATGEEPANTGGEEVDSGPVDELKLLPAAMQKLPYEEVSIPLHDQLIIYGRLYDPNLKPEGEDAPTYENADGSYVGPKYPLVILLHGLNHTHLAWSDLPATLVKAGYAVFAMDLRGHGKSTITTHKHLVTWRLFRPEDWLKLSKDVNEVMQYFQKGEDYPEVNGKAVALIGEKLGANIATYAARDRQDAIKAIILISPGLEYKGIDASRGLLAYPNNTLIVTSKDAKDSYMVANHLYNWITGPKALQIYQKIGEGADMINQQPNVQKYIVDWLIGALAPGPNGQPKELSPAAAEEITAPPNSTPEAPTPPGKDDAAPAAEKPAEKQ